ncbi:DUF3152 domain-containing protein [Micromonospora endophytica]|uniref:Uncharacterized protein n=1 Tax=Micromonospora endophytica TaxID=515350 RepID=A0A2W2BTM1_9ACTN|nr:DUF3152 domain-containing protein [Micromonospora endophytica]PZF90611.1 hypothetical protein C1I93_22560 [Micromonospora endophytica]RIW43101.1 DUF3152 domain-containing protein [Micromonospora endophytica]BCJ60102.1 lipoprotein [Micromonospora endophytica]
MPASPRHRLPPVDRLRWRRSVLTLVLVLAAVTTVSLVRTGDRVAGREPEATRVGPKGRVAEQPAAPSAYPSSGTGSFLTVDEGTPVRGVAGPVARYRVAVEQGAGPEPAEFAAEVDAVLADPRSWIGSGELRVQRVAEADAADFTVYLATPLTSTAMCAEGGLRTEGYTSCRLPGQVIINLARWSEAVPDYGAPLAVYRAYVINHEVGHEFGEGHEACPGPGRPAPVMQQQTYGLAGCVPNAWPFLDGHRYAGDVVP